MNKIVLYICRIGFIFCIGFCSTVYARDCPKGSKKTGVSHCLVNVGDTCELCCKLDNQGKGGKHDPLWNKELSKKMKVIGTKYFCND